MKKRTRTPTQTKLLRRLAHARTSPQCVVLRVGLILSSAQSGNTSSVATQDAVGRDTVHRWCQRWQSDEAERDRLETADQAGPFSESMSCRELETIVADAQRPGAPATFPEEQKRQILAGAARKPEDEGVPVTHWSHDLLAQTVIDNGIVQTISRAQIGRFFKARHPQASSQEILGTPSQ